MAEDGRGVLGDRVDAGCPQPEGGDTGHVARAAHPEQDDSPRITRNRRERIPCLEGCRQRVECSRFGLEVRAEQGWIHHRPRNLARRAAIGA